jgi:hypothetical protein
VAGDFASTNPRNAMLAGEASLVAAAALTVGQFAFADLTTGKVYPAFATGRRVGFVHRNNQAVVALGSNASMTIPTGKEVALFPSGDFYAIAPATVAPNDAVYTVAATGVLSNVNTDQATNFVFAEAATAGVLVKITRFSI